MLSHLRPIWEGVEEEVFGEGGFEQLISELSSTYTPKTVVTGNKSEDTPVLGGDSVMVDDTTTNEATQTRAENRFTLRSDGRPIARYNTSAAAGQAPGHAQPVCMIRFPLDRSKCTDKNKKRGGGPGLSKTSLVQSSLSPPRPSSSSGSSSKSSSPTYPLKPVRSSHPKVPDSSPGREKKNIVNRAYVDLPSPKATRKQKDKDA